MFLSRGRQSDRSGEGILVILRSNGIPCPQIHQREREELRSAEQPSGPGLLLQCGCPSLRIVPSDSVILLCDIDGRDFVLVLFFHCDGCECQTIPKSGRCDDNNLQGEAYETDAEINNVREQRSVREVLQRM